MSHPRYLYKFTSSDGSQAFEIPLWEYDWQPDGGFREAHADILGGDYGLDLLNRELTPRALAREQVSFRLFGDDPDDFEAQLDEMYQELYRFGKGKLWTIGPDGSERWAWGRLSRQPGYRRRGGEEDHGLISLDFSRYSDWYGEEVVEQFIINSSPQVIQVTNPGTLTTEEVEISFEALSSGGFVDPSFRSLTTGSEFSVEASSGSTGDLLTVDGRRYRVTLQAAGSGAAESVYDAFSYSEQAVAFFRVGLGLNSLEYEQDSGTPNLRLTVRFRPKYLR